MWCGAGKSRPAAQLLEVGGGGSGQSITRHHVEKGEVGAELAELRLEVPPAEGGDPGVVGCVEGHVQGVLSGGSGAAAMAEERRRASMEEIGSLKMRRHSTSVHGLAG